MLTSNRPYSTSGLRQVKVIPLFITHGIAERSVGDIVTKANVAMLGNINNSCPQQFWPDAIEYACHSDGFGFKNKISISPYFYPHVTNMLMVSLRGQ